jgi:hypothetical protein
MIRSLSFSSPMGSSRSHDNLSNSQILPIQHVHQSERLRKDDRDLDADEENWFNDDGDENRIPPLNHGSLFNGGSDDEDSQPETSGTTSAPSTTEPIRPHHVPMNNDDDDELPTTSTEMPSTSLRSQYTKPAISIHIRRSPISSVGQLSPSSSSTSADNDSATANGSPGSSIPRPITPTESTFAMVNEELTFDTIAFCSFLQSPGLSSIADQYNDDDDDDDDEQDKKEEEEGGDIENGVNFKSIQLNENSSNSDSYSSARKRKIGEDNSDDEQSSSSIPNDATTALSLDHNLEQTKVFKRSNDQSTM